MGLFSPRRFEAIDEAAVLRRSFAEPIGAPRLREVVGGSGNVLVLIDDGTRELGINVTRAGTIEIKTQCVRARVDRNKRVLKVSNAADLYQHKGSRRQSA